MMTHLYLFLVKLFCLFHMGIFTEPTCPKGWHHDVDGRTCYYKVKRKMILSEAQAFCSRLANSSHLLRVECGGENDYITSLLNPAYPTWIDARARFDIVDSSAGLFGPGFVFRWPNGKMVRFTNWADGQGIDKISKHEKCVQMGKFGDWKNAPCHSSASVICEKKLHRPYPQFCPKHWVYNNETQACYRAITKVNMTILDADDRCFQLGSEHRHDSMLASIEKLAKEKKANFDFVMLGAFGRSNNGNKWSWMDGAPFDYVNWDRGMPFGKKALAVLVMNKRGKWLNHYADRILSQYQAVAVCKFRS